MGYVVFWLYLLGLSFLGDFESDNDLLLSSVSVDNPWENVLPKLGLPKFSRFDKDAGFGLGDDNGERLDPILSIDFTLSRDELRFSGGNAFIDKPSEEDPFPRGGKGA